MLADFSYQENSKITGGAMAGMMRFAGAFSKQAREPITSTILVKGHRLAHVRPDSIEVIDVDKETITNINLKNKTYSVMTFDQMKQMMEQMSKQMQQSKNENNADVQFKASVKDTGQTKTIEGLNAKEMILTLAMEGTDKQSGQTGALEMTSDMWIAPVAGYEQVRNVHRLMAAKLGFVPGQGLGMLMQRPDMQKGMGDLYKEMAKMDGLPVEMIIRMGGAGSGQPGAATSNQQAPPPSGGDVAGAAASGESQNRIGSKLGGLAGGLGGFGGFGRRKKNADEGSNQTSAPAAQNTSGAGSGLLMEVTTMASGFSTAPVDGSKFEVPAGFKQVEPEMNRRRGR